MEPEQRVWRSSSELDYDESDPDWMIEPGPDDWMDERGYFPRDEEPILYRWLAYLKSFFVN